MANELPLQTVPAQKLIPGGEALGHMEDGRVVFLRGALPGELVKAEIVEDKRDFARARVTEVLDASALRVEPPCPRRVAGCGGCDWQHLAPENQLDEKTRIVIDALARVAKMPDAEVRPGESVSPFAYRTSLRVVGGQDRRASFRKEGSHQTVSADGCLIAHPGLLGTIESIDIEPDLDVSLRISASTKEMTAHWDIRRGDVSNLPENTGRGKGASITEEVAGFGFRVSSGSFFQSGPEAASLLVKYVKRAAPELEAAKTVVDAYAGVGLFALAATNTESDVIAIEASRWSSADCETNLKDRDASVVRARVEDWEADGPADVVIADPSRKGLQREGAARLAAAKARVIVLVSCDAATMARDTALLTELGYSHAGTEVLDLFPNTHHVECVTRFVKA